MEPNSGRKRSHLPTEEASVSIKRAKFLDDSEDSEDNGAILEINEDYALRFEHNKKRAELHRLEEKYGDGKRNAEDDLLSESDSEDESEDDAGELATEDLDAEISATINAIRSKDPRVYDDSVKFYREVEETAGTGAEESKEERAKPMFLKDYHRKNLLGENNDSIDDVIPPTYMQEQDALKQDIVKAMHEIEGSDSDSEPEEDGFLIRKTPKPQTTVSKTPGLDLTIADREPETYLSNFMASRAWIPTGTSGFQPLESDDEDEERRAEMFEEAYNLRFEDPEKSNEKLQSHARDVAAKYSVRREETSGRKSARDKERQKKEAEKKNRETERARLKKLKMEQMEEKVERIREAAGLSGKNLDFGEWATVLEEDWDDARFDAEMRKRFGDQYYQAEGEGSDDTFASHSRRKKPKKPKWDGDIDITDLIPDFDNGEKPDSLSALLSDDDEDDDDKDAEFDEKRSSTAKKSHKAARADAKATARRDRRLIESLVDASLPLETAPSSSKSFTPFRYRETSPAAFGLTALDILAADDAQLNEFAGLKKLAAFRDPERKKKDKKKLGKKARLRQWRKETFGDEEGPKLEEVFGASALKDSSKAEEGDGEVREGERKKKRKRSKKGKGVVV